MCKQLFLLTIILVLFKSVHALLKNNLASFEAVIEPFVFINERSVISITALLEISYQHFCVKKLLTCLLVLIHLILHIDLMYRKCSINFVERSSSLCSSKNYFSFIVIICINIVYYMSLRYTCNQSFTFKAIEENGQSSELIKI